MEDGVSHGWPFRLLPAQVLLKAMLEYRKTNLSSGANSYCNRALKAKETEIKNND